MTAEPSNAPDELVAREIASCVVRVRVALVLVGILYAWTACGNYYHLRPWIDGTMFETEPTGEIGRLIQVAYVMVVFAGVAGVASIVLSAVARKKTGFATYAAIGIFAVYTALRVYQTSGGYLSTWLWWTTAIVLGIGFQATYKVNRLRRSRALARAVLVA